MVRMGMSGREDALLADGETVALTCVCALGVQNLSDDFSFY
jgi:hypothetical protein